MMNTTQTHDSPLEATAAYRPTRGPESRPAVEFVAGSAPVSQNELVPLLRKRLQFLVLVFTVFYVVVAVPLRALSAHTDLAIDNWANAATLVALLGLLALLSGRRPMSLRQLRVIEFVLFAIFAGRVFHRAYIQLWHLDYIDRVHGWIAAGDAPNARAMLSGLAHQLVALSTMFVVAYGVIIPNTWRRCAVVVAASTALPIAIWIAACIDRGLPTEYWF